MLYLVSCLHVWEKVEEIGISFPSDMFVVLQRHRPGQLEMKHMLSLRWINSVACGNNRKPSTLFYYQFHNTLSAKCQQRKL